MDIRVLGEVCLYGQDGQVLLERVGERILLAALAIHAGQDVDTATLLRLLGDGGGAEQITARTLTDYIAAVRAALQRAGGSRGMLPDARRRRGTYRLDIDPSLIDYHRFGQHIRAARAHVRTGDHHAAAAEYRLAVGEWAGQPLAGIDRAGIDGLRLNLQEQHRAATQALIAQQLHIGEYDQALYATRRLIEENVADDIVVLGLHALARAGRRADIPGFYAQTTGRLRALLGENAQLSDEVRKVADTLTKDPQESYRLLPSGPTSSTASRELAGAHTRVDARAVPRQLPAAVSLFAGRAGELAGLTGLLRDRTAAGGTVVISAIGGTAGVGKTALAVYWAHQVADRFPDGQLYVNLRGFDPGGQVMDPAEAVRRFLDALGVPPERIPSDLDAQAALYRTELAGRRMLIVLDNARDSGQVRPLFPGAATCLVLVTSRNQLSGLVAADGAHPIALDLLAEEEARQLLTRRLGADRVAAEPQAVAGIITSCARLPLALAIVAARAATEPHLPLHALHAGLRDRSGGGRLDTLSTDDPATDVRAVFSWSYQALTPPAARLFRLLGLHPGPDTSAPAAASLASLPLPQVRGLLGELTRANLLIEHVPGRYTFHDLLRAYATEQAHTIDTDQQRHAARHRILDHYLHTAHTADRLLDPHRDPLTLAPPQPGVIPEHFTNHQQALDWYTAEHPVLLAAVDHATVTGLDTHTWQLAWTLDTFLDWRGHWHDLAATGQAAVAAAGRLADPTAQANAHRLLAAAYLRLGRLDDAHTQLHHALNLYAQAGDLAGQAHTHLGLSYLRERWARPAEALHHAQRALDLFRAAGHRRGQALALNSVGWCHALLGDHQQALTSCERALPLFQQLDDRTGQAAVWDSLGYAHHHLGQHAQALTCYRNALDLVRDFDDRYNEADTYAHLGDTHHAIGDHEAARGAWQQALTILDQLGHPDAHAVRVKLHDHGRTPP
jgi:tetratricopeptide (TPR) repeat protein